MIHIHLDHIRAIPLGNWFCVLCVAVGSGWDHTKD